MTKGHKYDELVKQSSSYLVEYQKVRFIIEKRRISVTAKIGQPRSTSRGSHSPTTKAFPLPKISSSLHPSTTYLNSINKTSYRVLDILPTFTIVGCIGSLWSCPALPSCIGEMNWGAYQYPRVEETPCPQGENLGNVVVVG